MSALNSAMRDELRVAVVPRLREMGFAGSMPHFRRPANFGIDVLTFQFDRNGGGFVIEIARSASGGTTLPWGKQVSPKLVTAHDFHPDKRHRIQPKIGSGPQEWFRFDDGNCQGAAQQVIALLPSAEEWWRAHA